MIAAAATAPVWAYALLAVLSSAVFTGALLFIRASVRENRQRLIEEMGVLFFEDADRSMVSFDYVRAKYEMTTAAEKRSRMNLRSPTTTFGLLGASIPYALLCAVGFLVLFVPMEFLQKDQLYYRVFAPNLFWSLDAARPNVAEAAAVYSAAFIGGYILTARVLLRAVQNYELSQLTFLQVAAHMAVGILTGMLLYHLFGAGTVDFRVCAGLAFVCGYMPDFGLTTLFRRLRINRLKQVDETAVALSTIAPLEMLDGIDHDIRYRLELSGFADVQNLAVANPLLIYVETPFSLYEAFDWVLQAQLCTAVGAKAFRDLKSLGIRTSLDLERAVLADDAPDPVVRAVGNVILTDATFAATQPLAADDVRHLVMVMLDDLHVHRLRHLWAHIFDEITCGGKRFWLYRESPGLGPAQARADAQVRMEGDEAGTGRPAAPGDPGSLPPTEPAKFSVGETAPVGTAADRPSGDEGGEG